MVVRYYSVALTLLALAVACSGADVEVADLVDELLQNGPAPEDADITRDLGVGARHSAANPTEVRRDRAMPSVHLKQTCPFPDRWTRMMLGVADILCTRLSSPDRLVLSLRACVPPIVSLLQHTNSCKLFPRLSMQCFVLRSETTYVKGKLSDSVSPHQP